MAQVEGPLDVVLHRAALNLKRRGAEEDENGRLEAVLAAIRYFRSLANVIARELEDLGFDLGSESRTSYQPLAEALLKFLMRKDVSAQYNLHNLWGSVSTDLRE